MTRFSRFLFLLALVLLIGHLLIYVQYAVGLLRFPFDYDQGEGFELVDTVMLSKGEWPYKITKPTRFTPAIILPVSCDSSPVCVAVRCGLLVWAAAGFVSTLITAFTIAYVVDREGRHRGIAALAGLSFLASNYIYHVGRCSGSTLRW